MPPVKKPKPISRHQTFLKEWREHRGLTLEAAAEKLDIHYTTIARIERGQSPYSQDFLERAAAAYECDVIDLLTVDPLTTDTPRLVFNAVKKAAPEKQEDVWRVVRAMLGQN